MAAHSSPEETMSAAFDPRSFLQASGAALAFGA
jgi:hypothetical protein